MEFAPDEVGKRKRSVSGRPKGSRTRDGSQSPPPPPPLPKPINEELRETQTAPEIDEEISGVNESTLSPLVTPPLLLGSERSAEGGLLISMTPGTLKDEQEQRFEEIREGLEMNVEFDSPMRVGEPQRPPTNLPVPIPIPEESVLEEVAPMDVKEHLLVKARETRQQGVASPMSMRSGASSEEMPLSVRSPVGEPGTEETSGDAAHRTESANLVASLELDVRPRTNIRDEKEEGPERKMSVVERDVQSQTKLPRVSNTGFRPHVLPELNARDLAVYKGSKDPRLCEPRPEEDKYPEKPGELVKIPQWYQLRLQENSAGTSEEGVYPTGASYELAQQFPERYGKDAVEGNFPPGFQSLQFVSEERIRNARVLIMMDSTMMPQVRHYCLLPDVVCVTMCNSTLEQMEAAVLVLADTRTWTTLSSERRCHRWWCS